MSKLKIIDSLDYLIGSHIGMGLDTGIIGVGTQGFLATKKFDISLSGISSHAGSEPEKGRSAILGACSLALGLHSLTQYNGVSRVNVGQISGGTGRNVVAANAKLLVEIRSDKNSIIEDLSNRLVDMTKGIAAGYQLNYKIDLVGFAEMFSTRYKDFSIELSDYLREKGYFIKENPSLGCSEDVSFYLNRVEKNGGRVIHYLIGSKLKGGHHNEKFDFDEKSLALGVNLYMDTIYKFNDIENKNMEKENVSEEYKVYCKL